jgi:hypothetical protein
MIRHHRSSTGPVALILVVVLLVPVSFASEPSHAAALVPATADNGDSPFAGDGPLLTTISPNGDGFRDAAAIRIVLPRPSRVELDITEARRRPKVVYTRAVWLPAGENTVSWAPPPGTPPETYRVRMKVGDARVQSGVQMPVVRVQGIDAAFGQASYAPGKTASLSVASDASSFLLQLFRCGPERAPTLSNDTMNGVAVTSPVLVDWRSRTNAPQRLRVPIGRWTSGLYFAKLTAPDGRIGFAPFVLRPRRLGESPVAVVMPTNTWQAYNFEDRDGDGVGDTWYAAWHRRTVRLARPYLERGVPPHFRRYDLPFLHWLAGSGHRVDFLSDADLERLASGDRLANAYALIVFPGHHEYVTSHEYGIVERYRDLGGNLAFLSANNFFWRVARHGPLLERTAQWRDLGRPEAGLIGAQYRDNDRGGRQAPFVVRNTEAAPWLFEGTGLHDGSRFGRFGIEIDSTASASPPATHVLAEIPDLYGPGFTAQMTYYETPGGAKVFAAGAFTLAGSAGSSPESRLLDNLWAQLSRP